ncbi:DciA family protein [Streptomyces sp. NPDC001404]|uniref:DciA family protein n=1 Tax=Streptomyces sp. NPDC001404 TaxID=3364571 RepID=UPI0036BC9EB4
MKQLLVDRGWQGGAVGGSLIDQWPSLVGPDRAAHWQAVDYDETTRTLTVACDSDSWATALRLAHQQVLADANQALQNLTGDGKASILDRIAVRRSGPRQPHRAASAEGPPPPSAPANPPPWSPSSEYAAARMQLRERKVKRDAEAGAGTSRWQYTLREPEEAFAEALYVTQAAQEQSACNASTHAQAVRRARMERANRSTQLTCRSKSNVA